MSQIPAAPQERRTIKAGEQPPVHLAGNDAKGGIAAAMPKPSATEAPLTAGDKIGDGLPPLKTPVDLADAPEMAAREEAKAVAPLRPAYKAYAVIALGHDNFWELQEVILDPNTGTFKVARRTIPNTKDICTGRAISCLDGVDGFEYGSPVS